MEKPILLVSKCLEFSPCRYNGQLIPDDFIGSLREFVTFKQVCPEVEIGLGIPRYPIRIISKDNKLRLVQPKTKIDITDKMNNFTKLLLEDIGEIDGVILKHASPSCGISSVKIYSNIDQKKFFKKGKGFFGNKILTNFPKLPIEDEGRLKSFKVREMFLIQIFTLSRFRNSCKSKNIKDLINFHSYHKYLFKCFDQCLSKEMGALLASYNKENYEEIKRNYYNILCLTLQNELNKSNIINVLLNIYGHFKDKITSKEKAFFHEEVKLYKKNKKPLASVISVLNAWALRFNDKYIDTQLIFEAYPQELMSVRDSGKICE